MTTHDKLEDTPDETGEAGAKEPAKAENRRPNEGGSGLGSTVKLTATIVRHWNMPKAVHTADFDKLHPDVRKAYKAHALVVIGFLGAYYSNFLNLDSSILYSFFLVLFAFVFDVAGGLSGKRVSDKYVISTYGTFILMLCFLVLLGAIEDSHQYFSKRVGFKLVAFLKESGDSCSSLCLPKTVMTQIIIMGVASVLTYVSWIIKTLCLNKIVSWRAFFQGLLVSLVLVVLTAFVIFMVVNNELPAKIAQLIS